MTASPSARDVALDRDWIPHAFEADGRHLTFVHVPRAARNDLLFLTEGHFRNRFRKVTLPTAAVAPQAAEADEVPLHFIFNTSFCCSTLLARALEVPGTAASIREPNILVSLAERLIATDMRQTHALMQLGLKLLARPPAGEAKVIVKPSNFAMRLLEPILLERPGSRAILLYSDAGTYLRAIVKRGLLARINARRLYKNLDSWSSVEFGFSAAETFEQTDLQIAGLAWLMQVAHFKSIGQRFGPQRTMIIDAAELLAHPAASLERAQSLFQLGLDPAEVRAIVDGPVFAKHSKFPDVDYDVESRERDAQALMNAHSDELAMVLQWIDAVAAHLGIAVRPGA